MPVFVDIDQDTWCISPEAIEEAVTPKTKGIVVVHILGQPALATLGHQWACSGMQEHSAFIRLKISASAARVELSFRNILP